MSVPNREVVQFLSVTCTNGGECFFFVFVRCSRANDQGGGGAGGADAGRGRAALVKRELIEFYEIPRLSVPQGSLPATLQGEKINQALNTILARGGGAPQDVNSLTRVDSGSRRSPTGCKLTHKNIFWFEKEPHRILAGLPLLVNILKVHRTWYKISYEALARKQNASHQDDADGVSESLAWLRTDFSDEAPCNTAIYYWFSELKRGWVNLSNEFRDGCLSTAVNNKKIDSLRRIPA
ncbi:hypothetical protein EVAR_29282_1 [Eumeta japonica]|uniref:Uncharacterized protein n=1 Tax=Eumeta variegata TaxID=151549 RepID=A0A4C1VW94_EUMVA|nr:hypothetical protein EVAR_29282_1 [Eumeta japonica]